MSKATSLEFLEALANEVARDVERESDWMLARDKREMVDDRLGELAERIYAAHKKPEWGT